MPFWIFRKKKRPAEQRLDPIAAFDSLLEALGKEASQIRKSAATLLSLRGGLSRDLERYRTRIEGLERRLAEAAGDPGTEAVLLRDHAEARELLVRTEAALASAQDDAHALLEAGEALSLQIRELSLERDSAHVRLAAGQAVIDAMRQRVERFGEVVAVEKARDELERARQLAQLYRDEAKQR